MRGLDHVGGNAFQLFQLGVVREGVGGIKRVFAELLAQFGLALLNLRKALLVFSDEFGAAQHKVAHGIAVRLALFDVQPGLVNRLVLGIEALVRAEAGPELGHSGQGFVVGLAQLG